MNQSQGVSGVVKACAKFSNKKGWTNKYYKQQKIDKKENENRDTKRNNGVHHIDGKWMCIFNKGFEFNISHTTGFHDTWDDLISHIHYTSGKRWPLLYSYFLFYQFHPQGYTRHNFKP